MTSRNASHVTIPLHKIIICLPARCTYHIAEFDGLLSRDDLLPTLSASFFFISFVLFILRASYDDLKSVCQIQNWYPYIFCT